MLTTAGRPAHANAGHLLRQLSSGKGAKKNSLAKPEQMTRAEVVAIAERAKREGEFVALLSPDSGWGITHPVTWGLAAAICGVAYLCVANGVSAPHIPTDHASDIPPAGATENGRHWRKKRFERKKKRR
jgi:hypothetical protein